MGRDDEDDVRLYYSLVGPSDEIAEVGSKQVSCLLGLAFCWRQG